MTDGAPEPSADAAWFIDVTDADIAAAKRAWTTARAADPASRRTQQLHQSYERLVRTQGRQLGERLRRTRPVAGS